ncbi:MAG: sugar phosphate isomerase/epimerase [Chloroflexi bacterium]|nr:sugar phosphate isomerase/epimerase [Chloroflexota bacterium]
MFKNLGPGAIGVKANLPESIALAKKYGFKGVEFSISEAQQIAEAQGFDALRALFQENNILPGHWGFPVNFRGDESTWQAGLKALPKQAELAKQLNCLRTATWIMPADNELDFFANFNFHVTRLRPAAEILKDYGCSLGLEFVGPKTVRNPRQHNFVHSLDGMLGLCAAIGTGNMGLLLDIYHLYTSHGTIDDIRKGLRKEDIVVVHLNDSQPGEIDELEDLTRALPCETGVMDVASFLQAVDELGYDGPVTIEPFSKALREMTADDAVRATGAAMDKAWQVAGLA